jgi:hypothetical protein
MLRRRHLDSGQALSLGVVSGNPESLAYRFWSRYASATPGNIRFLFKFGSWIKILNPSAMARAGIEPFERWGARLMGPVLKRTLFRDDRFLRPYRTGDLAACAHLLERATCDMDWALVWSEERLSRQLEGTLAQTFVFERNDEVLGLVNYHLLPWQGREPLRIAMLDLWAAPDLKRLEQASMLGSVCHGLRDHDVDAVVCFRSAMFPSAAMLSNAFVPLPARDHVVALFPQPQVPLTPPKTWNILLR